MITTAWNTGRLYTDAGQRIAAAYDFKTNRITFVDTDRMIDGVSTPIKTPPCDEKWLRQETMAIYDKGWYGPTFDCAPEPLATLHSLARNAPRVK